MTRKEFLNLRFIYLYSIISPQLCSLGRARLQSQLHWNTSASLSLSTRPTNPEATFESNSGCTKKTPTQLTKPRCPGSRKSQWMVSRLVSRLPVQSPAAALWACSGWRFWENQAAVWREFKLWCCGQREQNAKMCISLARCGMLLFVCLFVCLFVFVENVEQISNISSVY